MDEMEFFCKMIVALVEAEEEDNNETMTKDDNINICRGGIKWLSMT